MHNYADISAKFYSRTKKVMQSLIEWMILTPNCTRAACMYVEQKKHHRIFLKCNNQQHSVFGTSQSSHSLVVSQIVHFYKNWVDFQKQILARCSSLLKLRPVVICGTCWWIHFYYGNYYFVLLVTMLISWWRCRCCVALAQFSAAILLLWLFKRPESCAPE